MCSFVVNKHIPHKKFFTFSGYADATILISIGVHMSRVLEANLKCMGDSPYGVKQAI